MLDDEEDTDMIFGSAKTKSNDIKKLFTSTTPKPADPSKDMIMSRNTFNEN